MNWEPARSSHTVSQSSSKTQQQRPTMRICLITPTWFIPFLSPAPWSSIAASWITPQIHDWYCNPFWRFSSGGVWMKTKPTGIIQWPSWGTEHGVERWRLIWGRNTSHPPEHSAPRTSGYISYSVRWQHMHSFPHTASLPQHSSTPSAYSLGFLSYTVALCMGGFHCHRFNQAQIKDIRSKHCFCTKHADFFFFSFFY